MNALTLTPRNSYPLFRPNQVLSDRDLNHLVSYLESQNRVSRNHFMGMGIAFGLVPSAAFQSNNATITLSTGSGITSEGQVISLPQAVELTHYQNPQVISAARFRVSAETSSQDTSENTVAAVVTPDSTGDETATSVLYTVTELFEGEGGNPNRQPLHKIVQSPNEAALPQLFQGLLEEHIVVILREQEDTTRDTCLLECDDLGQDRNFKQRYFLLPKTRSETDPAAYLSATHLLDTGYAPDTLPAPWEGLSVPQILHRRQSFFQRYQIQVPRFGVDSETAPNIDNYGENYTAFTDYYRALCNQTIEQLRQVLPHVIEIFSPFFSSFQPASDDFASIADELETKLENIKTNSTESAPANAQMWEASYTIQYFYDYLVQIVAAYHELVNAAFDLMADSLPDIRRFPKFLMLGQVYVASSDASERKDDVSSRVTADPYRSHFVQPPLYNQNHQRQQQVRSLYDRLVSLCAVDNFAPLPFYAAPVHISPSRDRTNPLSKQAIPYYLNYAELYPRWNYDAERKGESDRHPAYFSATHDLRYRLDDYNFYRIEGHLGKDKATLLEQLLQYRQRWNLAFNVVTLKIGSDVDPDDGDTIDDVNQSRRLDAINRDFEGMTSLFQTLWRIYEEDWSQNTFLVTLKTTFFDQSKFSDISLGQLYNPVLSQVRSDTDQQSFTFKAVENSQPSGRYTLEISKANNERLATVFFQRGDNGDIVNTLNLSGRTESERADEKNRIATAISTALVADSMTYGVVKSSDLNRETLENVDDAFFVTLLLTDTLAVPLDPPGNPLRQVRVVVMSADSFTVDTQSGNLPLIEQPDFRDYETLYGLLRDIPSEYALTSELSFSMGDRTAALDYIQAFHLPERIEAYRMSEGQIVSPQLFNVFTQRYPGIEHLGGVPKGGTFILAYADDPIVASDSLAVRSSPDYQSRVLDITESANLPDETEQELEQVQAQFSDWKNIVVADFCLPYHVGDLGSHRDINLDVSDIAVNLPPIVLLEKTSFCADDDNVYDFLLYPPNGQLKGEGSFFANGKYRFQPTRVSPDLQHDVAIALTYAVEGGESSLVILVSPNPDTRFLIGKPDKTVFCTVDENIPLIPCFGRGTFTAWDGETDISDEVIQENRLFQPAQVTLDEADSKEIIFRHRISNEQETCVGETSRTVTIYAQPAVNFEFDREDNSDGGEFRVCADVATIELIGEPNNGVFRVLDGNQDISRRMLRGDRLLPSALNLGSTQDKTIQVEYSVVDENGCINEITKPLTILALPDAGFQIEESDTASVNFPFILQGSGPVRLIPNTPGGRFTVRTNGTDITSTVIETQADEVVFVTENFTPKQSSCGMKLLALALQLTPSNRSL